MISFGASVFCLVEHTETTPDVTILTAKDLIAKVLPQVTVDVILVLDSTYTGSLRTITDAATGLLDSASESSSFAVCVCLGADGHGHPETAQTVKLTPKNGPTKEAFQVIFYKLSLKQLQKQKKTLLEANTQAQQHIAKIAYKIEILMNGEGTAGEGEGGIVYSGEVRLKGEKTKSEFSTANIIKAHECRERDGYHNIVYQGVKIRMYSARERVRSTKATLEGNPECVRLLCMFIQNMSSVRKGTTI